MTDTFNPIPVREPQIGALLAIRYAFAIVGNARVVPGIDGSTEESTTKIFDQPNGRPSVSLDRKSTRLNSSHRL